MNRRLGQSPDSRTEYVTCYNELGYEMRRVHTSLKKIDSQR